MATSLQAAFLNAFSWLEIYIFRFKFHWFFLISHIKGHLCGRRFNVMTSSCQYKIIRLQHWNGNVIILMKFPSLNALAAAFWTLSSTTSYSQYKQIRQKSFQCINGLVQDCSNSIANALELLQFCTKPAIWCCCYNFMLHHWKVTSSFWCFFYHWWHRKLSASFNDFVNMTTFPFQWSAWSNLLQLLGLISI